MSFPAPGYAFSFDVSVGDKSIMLLLDRCDEITAAAGGRVYLAKDARLRADTFASMYPRRSAWLEIVRRYGASSCVRLGHEPAIRAHPMTDIFASRSALIIGASSLLGRELARKYAASGWRVVLAGRDADELGRVASDVAIRERAMVETIAVDLADTVSVDAAAAEVLRKGVPLVIIFVAGVSDGSSDAPYDPVVAQRLLAVNYAGQTRMVGALLPALKSAPGSMIAFVSSVAGDRGRRNNFVYGAAKAALNTYCQGLRALLAPNDVGVLTIKLGYMDTRLAYGVAPPALTCSPAYAANAICRSIERRRMVVYVPGFWRLVCFALRAIPERVFIRLPIP